jgi:hypothetical protein
MVESGSNLSINDSAACILMILLLLLDYPYASLLRFLLLLTPISSIGLLIFCMRALFFIRLVDFRSIEQRYCTLYRSWQ